MIVLIYKYFILVKDLLEFRGRNVYYDGFIKKTSPFTLIGLVLSFKFKNIHFMFSF